MDNKEIITLINKFEESSNYTMAMKTSLESFTNVLMEFNTSANQISEIQSLVDKNDFFVDLQDKTEQISTAFEALINELSLLRENTSDAEKKVTQLSNECKKEIEIFGSAIGPISDLEQTMRKIDQIAQKIEGLINSKMQHNLSDFNTNVIHLSAKIEETEKLFSENLSLLDNNMENLNAKIEAAVNIFNTNSKDVNLRIDKLLQRNDALINIVQMLAQNSNEALEKFTVLADNWAENNIHSVALKKKKDKKMPD